MDDLDEFAGEYEHGVGDLNHDYVKHSRDQYPGYGIHNSYPDHLSDEIMYSSPSPSERRVAFGICSYSNHSLNHSNYEEITQFEENNHHDSQGYYSSPIDSREFSPDMPHFNLSVHQYPNQERPFSFRQYLHPTRQNNIQVSAQMHSLPEGPRNEYQAPQPNSIPPRISTPRNSHRTRLRPVSELPDMYRGIFKFGVFNAIQSACFDTVVHSDENLVISAPTGSGKTVLFELAMIRMLLRASNTRQSAKCVYMAPTKALCSERYRDWAAKFDGLGIKCCELTGDTVQFGRSAWGEAQHASVIITTGEKWDSLTRNWREHHQILAQIQLVLVDEVHILNDVRGSTLEVVISRMKLRGSAVRFALVSATAPNIDDIANWIGGVNDNGPATIFQFGEEFRPCRLTKFVYGFKRSKHENDFVFTRNLDYRIFASLVKHSTSKPILVFVSTRKGTFATAEQLIKEYEEALSKRESLPWTRPPKIDVPFYDKRLGDLAASGVGVHHAGLTTDDRRAVEDLYLKGILRVVVATSTLAVGVNLPAHTVVIKGVHTFQSGVSVEYSDLEVMQMLGRAGRPQFDKEGMAIILCESQLENKYKSLVQGTTVIESCLHRNLSEHLNSEIGLGTITNIDSAKKWLRNSFLFQRLRKNPKHYALGKDDCQTWEERIDDLVTENIAKLQETELVVYTDNDHMALKSTEYGDIMSKFYIRQSTMGLILSLPARASMREILEMISFTEELAETKLRSTERQVYNNLRMHNDIRFEVKKVANTSDKVFLIIQAVLGGISLNSPEYRTADSQPQLDAFNVFRHLSRIVRATVEVAIVRRLGTHMKHGLELLRCFAAKAWEDRPVVLRQIEQIGEKSVKVLAEHGVTSIALLRQQDPLRIDVLLNRRPPFGFEVIAAARELPQYLLEITEVESQSSDGENPVELIISIKCGLMIEETPASKQSKQKSRGLNVTSVLTITSDMEFVDFRRIQTKALKIPKVFEVTAQLTKPSQSICVYVASESIAGVTVTDVYKPKFDAKKYPKIDTRPRNAMDMDLEGLEDIPDLWNIDIDELEQENIQIKDLTKFQAEKKLPRTSHQSRSSLEYAPPTIPKVLDRVPTNTKKLPNGNYECNHHCKDKTKCRHPCCRNGTPDLRKQGVPYRKSSKPKVIQRDDIGSKPKSSKTRIDRKFQDLESLHERTNVTKNLKLPDGRRLKLSANGKSKIKQKAVPNFDVELADINNDDVQILGSFGNCRDDDDLPEPSELLKPLKRAPSSETNYSDSDIDMIIRDMPLEEPDSEHGVLHAASETSVKTSQALGSSEMFQFSVLSPPSISLKRGQETPNVAHRAKRTRLGEVEDPHCANPRPISLVEKITPLFLPGSFGDEDSEKNYMQTPGRTWHKSGETKSLSESSTLSTIPTLAKSTQKPDAKAPLTDCLTQDHPSSLDSPKAKENSVTYDDDWADIEAWLYSGAVRIVPDGEL